MEIRITHNIAEVTARLQALPVEVTTAVDAAMGRGAAEMARDAQTLAPKNSSELTKRIGSRRVGVLAHDVFADAEHASYVEQGTQAGGRPSLDTTLEWMARAGVSPTTPGMSRRSLASLIRRNIARYGIEKQPFMAPALLGNASRLQMLLRTAITTSLPR